MSKWEVIQALRKSLFPKTAAELESLGITKAGNKLGSLWEKPCSILERIVVKGEKGRECYAYYIKKGIKKRVLDAYKPYSFIVSINK